MRQPNPANRIFNTLPVVIIIIIISAAGYCFTEGWPILGSLYLTMITLFTAGFKEYRRHEKTHSLTALRPLNQIQKKDSFYQAGL
jgi:hypothetical protein